MINGVVNRKHDFETQSNIPSLYCYISNCDNSRLTRRVSVIQFFNSAYHLFIIFYSFAPYLRCYGLNCEQKLLQTSQYARKSYPATFVKRKTIYWIKKTPIARQSEYVVFCVYTYENKPCESFLFVRLYWSH